MSGYFLVRDPLFRLGTMSEEGKISLLTNAEQIISRPNMMLLSTFLLPPTVSFCLKHSYKASHLISSAFVRTANELGRDEKKTTVEMGSWRG